MLILQFLSENWGFISTTIGTILGFAAGKKRKL